MSQFKGMTRYGRRVRLAAMVVTAALALPGLALANHTTCNKQSNEVGAGINCPEFSPGIEAIVSNPVIDSESTLSYEYSQADHESSTMLVEAYAPKYWQFNTQLRPSASPDACSGNAEAISGNSWRLRSLAGSTRAVTERTGAAYFANYDAVTETIAGCARLSGSVNLPFTIARIPGTHPYAATHGWKITISTRAFVESIKATEGSMTRFVFDLNQRTSGTWHQNQSGQLERAIFSQASHTPVTTDLRADATSCRRGMDGATSTGCRGDATLVKTVATAPFNISPAPTGSPLDFAKMTGPNRIAGTSAESGGPTPREGFGLVNGGNTATATWNQPPANPNETVKGYAVTIAVPGNEGSQSGRYLLKAGTCGPTGAASSCSTTFTAGSLPRLDGIGSLHPNVDPGGKYDIALVTIYDSGKRSDGRCDDGTWAGALCAPTTPLWQVRLGSQALYPAVGVPAGNSWWQFLWRTHAYPKVTVDTESSQPFMLLFVDYSIKEAEFVIFGSYIIKSNIMDQTRYIQHGRAGDGPATSFKSRDNRIIGDGTAGIVSFTNSASPTGTAVRFDFTGQTGNNGSFGLVSLTEPGDIALGSSVPPSPTSSRKASVAIEVMEGSNA